MLCIINCQYTHNQGKLCQNFQFFHIYITLTPFSVNMHHFSVEKPRISVEITEISPGIHRNFVFEFKSPFRSKIAKSAEISAEIPFPVIGGILRKNGKVNPGKEWRGASGWSEREGGGSERGAAHRTEGACGSE